MSRRHLAYTIALDQSGDSAHRNMAKMLVSSLLRTGFSGDIVVFHNSRTPIFHVPRVGVTELVLEVPHGAVGNAFQEFALACKYAVAPHLPAAKYDKLFFVDCDMVALRNIDHLLEGDWELAFCVEPGTRIQDDPYGAYLTDEEREHLPREGINAGSWAVSAQHCSEFFRRWREVQSRPSEHFHGWRDQVTFTRVVLDWAGVTHEWPRHEIALPLCNGHLHTYGDFRQATLVHAATGAGADYKLRFLFSLFAGAFLYDSELTLLNIMEM